MQRGIVWGIDGGAKRAMIGQTSDWSPMEPQDVQPLTYARPRSDDWGRILKILSLFSIIFAVVYASLGSVMIYLSSGIANIAWMDPLPIMRAVAITDVAGGAVAIAGGIVLLRRRRGSLLAIGIIILVSAQFLQAGVELWNWSQAASAVSALGGGGWALW